MTTHVSGKFLQFKTLEIVAHLAAFYSPRAGLLERSARIQLYTASAKAHGPRSSASSGLSWCTK